MAEEIDNREKRILIFLFCVFFILSALSLFVMLKKDTVQKEQQMQAVQNKEVINSAENIWPKVEIQARQ